MSTSRRAPVVVIGLGNPMRRDDGVGPAVVGAIEGRISSDVDVVLTDGEPTRLLEAWRERVLAVVVDTIVAGVVPGTIHQLELGVDPLPPARATASSHQPGIEAAVDLSRVLDTLPGRLVVLGIEPGDTDHGEGLTDAVADALPDLVARVRQLLEP